MREEISKRKWEREKKIGKKIDKQKWERKNK